MELVHSIQPNKGGEGAPLLTCNTCGLGFPTIELQRSHMKTEWHRYNLKRRVAALPPISSEVFAEKVLLQQNMNKVSEERTGRGSSGRSTGQRQVTKKDKKKEEKLLRKEAAQNSARHYRHTSSKDSARGVSPAPSESSVTSSTFSLGEPATKARYAPSLTTDEEDAGDYEEDSSGVSQDEDEEDIVQRTQRLRVEEGRLGEGILGEGRLGEDAPQHTEKDKQESDDADDIDEDTLLENEIQKKLSSGVEFPPNVCFMDGKKFDTVEENVAYLSKQYGLFIPERDYLVDLPGLITYFGEKVGIGNMCLFCHFEGRSLESARSHMLAKSHVKIPYDSVEDQLEISEFYDFRSSYRKRPKKVSTGGEDDEEGEWVDEDDMSDEDDLSDEEGDDFDTSDAAYVDPSGYQLIIAPGVAVGHRSLQRYYKQSFRPIGPAKEGQSTVLAVDRRSHGLLTSRDPEQARQQKLVWKEENKQKRHGHRITLTTNFQRHFRDELLQ